MIGPTHRLWATIATIAALHAQRAFVIPPTLEVSMVLPVATIIGGAVLGGLPDLDLKLGIPHRTITHAIWWPLLIWFFLPAPVGPALGFALLTHPLLDCLAGRVQIFWPLPWWVGMQLVKTGGATETMFNIGLGVWVVWNVFK